MHWDPEPLDDTPSSALAGTLSPTPWGRRVGSGGTAGLHQALLPGVGTACPPAMPARTRGDKLSPPQFRHDDEQVTQGATSDQGSDAG